MGSVDWLRQKIPIIVLSALLLSLTVWTSLPVLDVYHVNTSPDFDYRAVKSLIVFENGEVASVDGRTIYVSSRQDNMILRYRLRHLDDKLRIASYDNLDVKFIGDGCTVISDMGRDEVVFIVIPADNCDLTITLRVSANLIEKRAIGRYQVTDTFKLAAVNNTSHLTNGHNSRVVELAPVLIKYEYTSLLKDKLFAPIVTFTALMIMVIFPEIIK